MGFFIKDDPHQKTYATLADAQRMAQELVDHLGRAFEIRDEETGHIRTWATSSKRHRDELRHMFFNPAIIDPIPPLVSLRQKLLEISHERLPKWLFRLAPDLVVQMQPRPGERRDKYALFLGLVVEGPEITKAHFASWKGRAGLPLTAIGFRIREVSDGFYSQHGHGRWVVSWTRWNLRAVDVMRALKDRFIEALPKLHNFSTKYMFQPACLACDRRLTDPVSMARWIGPECLHHFGGKDTLIVKQITLS